MISEALPDPLRILLVEDNEHDRIAFRRSITKNGVSFQMEEYDRGEEALHLLSANPGRSDVVVVDYDLPGITGLEFFEDLKQRIGELHLPPFLMLTGAGTEDLAVKAIKAGIYDYVVKDPEDRYLKLLPTVLISIHKRHAHRLAYLEAQQQLARAHQDLEKKVSQRTRELARTVETLKSEVSVRMKTEQALRESRKRIRKLSLKAIEAQENERKAIAQELHDSIGGNLAAIKMSLETRIKNMGDPPAEGILPLEKIAGYLKSTIDELRHISARLRPKDLDSLGLRGAIHEICRRIEGQYQGMSVSPQFHIEEEDVSDAIKLVIYRIMQEAVTNAAKHASAKNVLITVAKDGNCVHLSIEDDGCGFDPKTIGEAKFPGGGYGLKNMQDRAELNNGSLHVTSTPGAGTRVRAVLPLAGPEAE
jgi:signal transduction histidine kinase